MTTDPHPTSAVAPSDSREEVLLEYTVHLARTEPARACAVLGCAALSGFLGWALFHSLLFAILGPAMVIAASAEFLLPIRYRLTNRRACAAYGAARLEIEWPQVRRVLVGETGVKLSPLVRAGRLDAFRGVVLRADSPMRRKEIESLIGRMLGREIPAYEALVSTASGNA